MADFGRGLVDWVGKPTAQGRANVSGGLAGQGDLEEWGGLEGAPHELAIVFEPAHELV